MRKRTEIIKAANELYEQLTSSLEEFKEVRKEQIKEVCTAPYAEAHEIVSKLVEGIRALIVDCSSEAGITFPKYLVTFKTFESDGKLTSVNVVIKSKLKDTIKYRKEVFISVDDNFMDELCKVHVDGIFDMYYKAEANENLKEVNEFIYKLCVEHNIPYTFDFTLTDGKDYITYIDDTKVTFNASLESALELANDALFQSGDAYFDYVREQQILKLTETLEATQTTVQLLKANIDIITGLVGYSTKKRADRLIRITYHKKAEFFNSVKKGGYGYFEFKSGDDSFFSILEKKADGEIVVALSPFNIKTLETVDIDVIAELKKATA